MKFHAEKLEQGSAKYSHFEKCQISLPKFPSYDFVYFREKI